MYTVDYLPEAKKALKKLNPHIMQLIVKWITKNLNNCENPRAHGIALSANLAGAWRYRIGNYRIIVFIDDINKAISVFDIGHRKNIYD